MEDVERLRRRYLDEPLTSDPILDVKRFLRKHHRKPFGSEAGEIDAGGGFIIGTVK